MRLLQRRQQTRRQQRRLTAARWADDGEHRQAAHTLDRLLDLRLAPVETSLLGRGEGLHTGVGAGRCREGDARPFLCKSSSNGLRGIGAQSRRQQSLQTHALVAQRPQHQVVADVVPVAPRHRHDRIQAEAEVAVQPRHHHLAQLVERKRIFQCRAQLPYLVAAQRNDARRRSPAAVFTVRLIVMQIGVSMS